MIYKGFASVYDHLMLDTPYKAWYDILKKTLNEHEFNGKTFLDLACGTGEMTARLAKDGYKAMGVDLSGEMLEIAQNKAYEQNLKVQYIKQDMTSLELFHTYDAVISFCDGFNYITDKEALSKTFKLVHHYLNKEGLFIFDMSSPYKLQHVLGQNVFTETSDEVVYIWENYYDDSTKLLEFDLTIMQEDQGLYRRSDEVHIQRAYDENEIKEMLETSGFEVLEILDTNTGQKIETTTERLLFIGRKINE